MRTTLTLAGRGLILALAISLLSGCVYDIPAPMPPAPPPTQPPVEPPPPTPEPDTDLFDSVKVGMTEAQVIEILGAYDDFPQTPGGEITRRWTVVNEEGTFMLTVIFDANGLVTAKRSFQARSS